MKRCVVCSRELSLNSFYKDKIKKDGRTSTCKECSKKRTSLWQKSNPERKYATTTLWRKANPRKIMDYKYRKQFGLPLGEYNHMLVKQGGVCAICRQPPSHNRFLALDHNHTTGEIRGLICWSCNRALGLFKDNPTYLHNALSYLSKTILSSPKVASSLFQAPTLQQPQQLTIET